MPLATAKPEIYYGVECAGAQITPSHESIVLCSNQLNLIPLKLKAHSPSFPSKPPPSFTLYRVKMSSPTQHTLTNPPNYSFPHHRLSSVLQDPTKTPIVLVACGSFNPVTNSHLRMFVMAKNHIRRTNKQLEVVGGYFSPVNDSYEKPGLISATHRVNMCTLAAEDNLDWLMVDTWESSQDSYQRTAIVLDHFDHELNIILGGVRTSDGESRRIRVMLVVGEDLFLSMSSPVTWSPNDVEHILGCYGAFVIKRHDISYPAVVPSEWPGVTIWCNNTYWVRQPFIDSISSTKVRTLLRNGLSIRYLSPHPVVDYIEKHELYHPEDGVRTFYFDLDESAVQNVTYAEASDDKKSNDVHRLILVGGIVVPIAILTTYLAIVG